MEVVESRHECANCWRNSQKEPENYEQKPAQQPELEEDWMHEESVEHKANQMDHVVAWYVDGDCARVANKLLRGHANNMQGPR